MKFSLLQQSHKGLAGFTLIETLVAIFIFSTALVALSGIAARGVSSVNRAKEVVTAQFLAQEGLEMVRNVRDTTTLENGIGVPWDNIFSTCTEDAPCDIDYPLTGPTLVSTSGDALWIENGVYTSNPSSGGSPIPTKFIREIWTKQKATNLSNEPIEYAVYSRIKWTVGTGSRSVEAVTTLSDWQ